MPTVLNIGSYYWDIIAYFQTYRVLVIVATENFLYLKNTCTSYTISRTGSCTGVNFQVSICGRFRWLSHTDKQRPFISIDREIKWIPGNMHKSDLYWKY